MNDQDNAHGARGIGLGSEPNQILAVWPPSPIDHLMLSLPGILASGRYMDDSYCIALDKQKLWDAFRRIEALSTIWERNINRKEDARSEAVARLDSRRGFHMATG